MSKEVKKMNTVIRNINKKAKEDDLPYLMPYLGQSWSDRHSQVREMWENPEFSHRELFQAWACWWTRQLSHSERMAHEKLYEQMERFSASEKAVPNPASRRLWKVMDGFFALYYIEFPFSCSYPPVLGFDSVEDFFKFLSE